MAQRAANLQNCQKTAVYVAGEKDDVYRLVASTDRRTIRTRTLRLSKKMKITLEAGQVLIQGPFQLMVPLYVPRLRSKELVGLLGIGLRKDGRGYSSDDKRALVELGGEVGIAIYAAQLRTKKKRT